MNISQLQSFVEVAACKNITAVAQSRNVSLQAVSRQIRDLEKDLGTKLFERRNNGVVLTPQGKTLLPRATKVVNAFAKCKLTEDEINATE